MNHSSSLFLLSSLLMMSIFTSGLATDVHGQSYGSATMSEPMPKDSEGDILTDVMTGQLVILSTTLNTITDETPFVAIMEVRNSDGMTEYLNWQSGTLTENTKVEVGLSWTPAKTGVYTVRTFALSSLTNPEVLSPVAASEVVVSVFTTEILMTTDLDSLSLKAREDLVRSVANTYKVMTEPFRGVEYEWLKYQIRFDGSTFYNDRESYKIWSNATAKIRNVVSYETYTLRGTYNTVDKLVEVTFSHDLHYLPEDSESAAINNALSNSAVNQFFARNGNNETASPMIIIPRAGYLDSREVSSAKYSIDNSGHMTERPEYTFLPDSGQVIEVVFVALPREAFESGEEIAGTGSPFIRTYLEPENYKVLGTYEFPGN